MDLLKDIVTEIEEDPKKYGSIRDKDECIVFKNEAIKLKPDFISENSWDYFIRSLSVGEMTIEDFKTNIKFEGIIVFKTKHTNWSIDKINKKFELSIPILETSIDL